MPIQTDVVIVGAGPVGLFQVFELGLQGIRAHVVDALPQPGGQCSELYPDKPIYDIPAIPECTGQELTDNLLAQIKPFEPVLHLEQTVDALEKRGANDFVLTTSAGETFHCRAVIIAAGAGSFTPVKLRLEGMEAFEGTQLNYRVRDPGAFTDRDVIILGGGDSAIDWALTLAGVVKRLTVVNRTEKFRAVQASVDNLMSLRDAGNVDVLLGQATEFRTRGDKLSALKFALRDEAGSERWVDVDDVLVFFGLSPKLGPIEHWGVELERKLVTIDQSSYETTVPGIYAIGDINTYPGKKKLILSGFHEAALAAFHIKQTFEPDKKIHLQYTTTSPLMHERLGVE